MKVDQNGIAFSVNGSTVLCRQDLHMMCRLKNVCIERRHCNEEYEVTIVLKGSCQVDVDDCHYDLYAGQGLITAPERYHILYGAKDDFERFSARYSIEGNDLPQQLRQSLPTHRVFLAEPGMVRICRETIDEYSNRTPYWKEMHGVRMKELLLRIFRLLNVEDEARLTLPRSTHQTKKQKIDRYMEEHLGSGLSMAELAQQIHVSQRQLSRDVQEFYGMSFRQKVLNLRMDRAAWLLRTTEMPMDKLVDAVGYSSEKAFSHAFLNFFQLSPRQYREQFSSSSPPDDT